MPRRRSRLGRRKQLRLIEHFVAGTPARTAAGLVGVHRNTATLFYHKPRETIATRIADESPLGGEVEIDESYFGGHRKGKRGRGAGGKTVVFGILKRGGKVYTAVPPDLARSTLLPILRRKVVPDSVVITDSLRVYDTPDAEGFRHERVSHDGPTLGQRDPGGRARHINGIENFWGQAERHLRRYNGIPKCTSNCLSKNASGVLTTMPRKTWSKRYAAGALSRPAPTQKRSLRSKKTSLIRIRFDSRARSTGTHRCF